MDIIPDYNHAATLYKQLQSALNEQNLHDPHIEKALNLWLYPLFAKIRKAKDLKNAKGFLPSPHEMQKQQEKKKENIIVNRKLVNALMNNAPDYKSANEIYEEYKAIVAERIDTINILLGHIKEEVGQKQINIQQKSEFKKLTIHWIAVIQAIEWNQYSTDAGRAHSILTSIAQNLGDKNLEEKIKELKLPDANSRQESHLYRKLISIKNQPEDFVPQLRNICHYYNSVQGEDIYEESDVFTHLIKYIYQADVERRKNNETQLLSEIDKENIRNMVEGAASHLPIDKLISPQVEFYEQVLYKILPAEYGFARRWEYIKQAYLRLYTCGSFISYSNKQADLLFKVLRPVAYANPSEPGDAIQKMQEDVYDFVKNHPVYITLFMAVICKLVNFYASTLRNRENPQKLHNAILPELETEFKRRRLVPSTEEEKKDAVKIVIKSKLERINILLMGLEFNGRPLPFDDRFSISIGIINESLKDLGPWFVKGPFNTLNDKIRHNAWDCYVERKTNLNYIDWLPKIIFTEVLRICEVMSNIKGEKKHATENFAYLNKELTLLKKECKNSDEYTSYGIDRITAVYKNFMLKNSTCTNVWFEDIFAQFSILCNGTEDLDKWNALHSYK